MNMFQVQNNEVPDIIGLITLPWRGPTVQCTIEDSDAPSSIFSNIIILLLLQPYFNSTTNQLEAHRYYHVPSKLST